MFKKKYFSYESLKKLNTFKINVTAKKIVFVKTIQSLINVWNTCKFYSIPFIILGEGSNVLFLKNYQGIVVINRIKGIIVTEKKKTCLLHVYSGEKWNDLVKYSLRIGFFGLENLALIPGCVGSAAIQNIGAYGAELKNVCQYVDVLSLNDNSIKRIYKNECKFSYRNSIFKHQYKYGYAIISVGIKLSKIWNPIIFHSFKKKIKCTNITPYSIFNYICYLRRNKLPNPKKTGSAGSFFKNPIISKKKLKKLTSLYTNIPMHLQKNGLVKISAAWLIEKYRFKNIHIGDAEIYKKQKLILINRKNATGLEILKLSKIITICILKKFNIFLQPEIDFIR
ncbi:UDP-N-acetylmuramate dehydrogenase [Buchnera aphidicola (Muscaphis stroyani)]|uniref:UDP-N-acetylenolpyruvoylglucosamine reductase n=1 Tax=Buchnera aphidicola (Muscaphis stroyani) TaxID=1241869 RepID=A0A4D6YEZ7_9GAMM|nr:UDP-N-acetylmuramate dehydrogenase [Buchnera aphidicola]QCI24160.1 UDP-N-acetylmuramate dehydrogenase [Buchnera aphidicola (Muscaphis stroyani)]